MVWGERSMLPTLHEPQNVEGSWVSILYGGGDTLRDSRGREISFSPPFAFLSFDTSGALGKCLGLPNGTFAAIKKQLMPH